MERYGHGVTFFPSTSLSAGYRMVAMGLGIGALPLIPAAPYVAAREIVPAQFDVQPAPLEFSASFVAGVDGVFNRQAAELARDTAEVFHKEHLSK